MKEIKCMLTWVTPSESKWAQASPSERWLYTSMFWQLASEPRRAPVSERAHDPIVMHLDPKSDGKLKIKGPRP